MTHARHELARDQAALGAAADLIEARIVLAATPSEALAWARALARLTRLRAELSAQPRVVWEET